MGGQVSVITPTASTIAIEAYLAELGDVQYEKNIGNARFLKTLKGMHTDGLLVIKVFVKPTPGVSLKKEIKELKRIKKCLGNVGNTLAYTRIVETERAGYGVRQFLRSNLYDRISTRPFLENIEKVWVTFQLLRGLEQCHQQNVYHGDIKSENVLVTSWNWVYLSDFAPYKPVYMPEDDPSHFSFYFDTSQRRCCYVAPERFLAAGEKPPVAEQLTQQMDIFSLGCVIGELFLEGTPTFTLAQLFKYKKREYAPPLEAIEDENIRDLVRSMTQLDASDRLSASEYLQKYRATTFPNYFYEFLHEYVQTITQLKDDGSTTLERAKQLESDYRIESVWDDFETISKQFGFEYPSSSASDNIPSCSNVLPVCLDLPGMNHWVPKLRKLTVADDDGALMIVAVVCTAIRNTSRASSRIKACEVLLALGERIHDEAKLDRCLPHLVSLLEDSSDVVQVAALRSLTHLLELVGAITPVNGSIFQEYILPRLYPLVQKSSVIVRSTYAACLSSLAQTASRFLDMGQVLKTTGVLDSADPETENGISTEVTTFDTLKQNLSLMIEEHAIALLTDSSAAVRRSLISTITPLCIFFGKQKTNDIILSHLITYLNDKDPFLRTDFFDCIVGLAPFVGAVSLEQYIIPLMIQTLADPVEFVVEKVLQAFTSLSDLGLIRDSRVWELLKVCAKFTIHPNSWIRNATVSFFASTTKWMSPAQVYCMHLPILRQFLECEINDFSEANLLRNLHPPLSRAVYNRTLTWASKAQKSIFWRIDKASTTRNYSNKKSSEDEQWLARLREIGLKNDDMWMLNVYKEYIYRVARLNHQLQLVEENDESKGVVKMQSLGVLPTTVFFDETKPKKSKKQKKRVDVAAVEPVLSAPVDVPAPVVGNAAGEAPPTRLLGIHEEDGNNTPSSLGESPTYLAQPVTSTVTTDVYGVVGNNSSSNGDAAAPATENEDNDRSIQSFKKSSSYAGDDPYIWKLLESMYYEEEENNRDDCPEFGYCEPFTRAGSGGGGAAAAGTNPTVKRRRGRPLGVLVSSFEEHTAPVNSVAVSPNHLFFVTGSDDGLVKIWDCYRLEKNVVNKSVQSIDMKSPVKCISFISSTCTVACGLESGVISMVRVEMTKRTASLGPRYKQLRVVATHQLDQGECAIAMEHIDQAGQGGKLSLLCIITSGCRIITLNVKTMTVVQTMQNPLKHGVVTSFVIDRRRNWVLVGTMFGVLDLWDLRFGLLVKSWTLSDSRSKIASLALHPRNDKQVCVSGGTNSSASEVTVWDVETAQCKEIYRGAMTIGSEDNETGNQSVYQSKPPPETPTLPTTPTQPPPRVNTILTGQEFELGTTGSTGRKGFMITAGSDRILRFWDLHTGESSAVISGIAAPTSSQPETAKIGYTTVHPDHSCKVVVEKKLSAKRAGGSGATIKPERLPRSTVISSDQLDLGRNHGAAIMDVALLLRPFEMVVSVDKAGYVKVYL